MSAHEARPIFHPLRTRGMLLTGVDNHRVGMGNMIEIMADNQFDQPGYEGYMTGDVVTVATLLRDSGYHTYMAGKWHLGHKPGQYPYDRGFDRSFSMLLGAASHWAALAGSRSHPDRVEESPWREAGCP